MSLKATFLSTSTSETTKYMESIRTLGMEADILRYDLPGGTEAAIYAQAVACKPDALVYIGSAFGPQISTRVLAKLNHEVAPMVHLCSDAADQPWHPLLMEYHYGGAFSLQVAIDGNKNWPLHDSQMTALTPVDPSHFRMANDHALRPLGCGFAGNPGGEGSFRRHIVSELMFHNAVAVRMRSDMAETYQGYCDFLMQCRLSLNVALTGTQTSKQVKGRVIESAYAGCCLLEQEGAPTSDWFEPGVDYLEYRKVDDCEVLIRELMTDPARTQEIGDRLRRKVLARHTPQHFWGRIMERIGVKVAA